MLWSVEFFEDGTGRQPARAFLLALEPSKRAALIAAIEEILEPRGLDVCGTEYGRQLGAGLFEFRVRHDETVIRGKRKDGRQPTGGRRADVLLRLFCHAHGDRIVLLLGGYDKGDDPSAKRQTREIEQARKRLRSFRLERQRRTTREKRSG